MNRKPSDLFDIACAITDVHNQALKADPTLAARLDTHPAARDAHVDRLTLLAVGTPVSAATPAAAICPTCRVFEKTEGAELCPKCLRVQANRIVKASRDQQRLDGIRREIADRVVDNARFRQMVQNNHEAQLRERLTEINPDWHHDMTIDQAEVFYRLELLKLP